ncbi:hypothetical protein [uncultured Draconibacterium sp.]|uniref:hypothetical protein n=1 Tax=uncultured Draconibacterium sp. TaxID=1573823 RepID=UPI002612A541|nr:hypothetical protein [uncultured Draconibacterium sp.]
MTKKLEERINEFSDERFMDHIAKISEMGMESDKSQSACDAIYFLTDLQKLVNEIKNAETI